MKIKINRNLLQFSSSKIVFDFFFISKAAARVLNPKHSVRNRRRCNSVVVSLLEIILLVVDICIELRVIQLMILDSACVSYLQQNDCQAHFRLGFYGFTLNSFLVLLCLARFFWNRLFYKFK